LQAPPVREYQTISNLFTLRATEGNGAGEASLFRSPA
jgi:hypothetical protein